MFDQKPILVQIVPLGYHIRNMEMESHHEQPLLCMKCDALAKQKINRYGHGCRYLVLINYHIMISYSV